MVTAIYEIHVAGQVGSITRSALPEMRTFEQQSRRVLHGTAAQRGEIDRLLELIQTMNLIVEELLICARPASGYFGGDVPVVDDRGAKDDVLE